MSPLRTLYLLILGATLAAPCAAQLFIGPEASATPRITLPIGSTTPIAELAVARAIIMTGATSTGPPITFCANESFSLMLERPDIAGFRIEYQVIAGSLSRAKSFSPFTVHFSREGGTERAVPSLGLWLNRTDDIRLTGNHVWHSGGSALRPKTSMATGEMVTLTLTVLPRGVVELTSPDAVVVVYGLLDVDPEPRLHEGWVTIKPHEQHGWKMVRACLTEIVDQ